VSCECYEILCAWQRRPWTFQSTSTHDSWLHRHIRTNFLKYCLLWESEPRKLENSFFGANHFSCIRHEASALAHSKRSIRMKRLCRVNWILTVKLKICHWPLNSSPFMESEGSYQPQMHHFRSQISPHFQTLFHERQF